MAAEPNLLIVEGKDDLHVMRALCDKLGMKGIYEVSTRKSEDEKTENVDTLLKAISVDAKESGRIALGVVVDKDTDDPNINKNRWEQIRGILTPMGYTLMDTPPTDGAVLASPELGFAKIGIWLMPDNQNPGMLEDFMRQLIVPNDDCLSFAEETLNELESRDIQRYKTVHRAKALMHTWIAWQDQPGIPLGQSTTRYLTTDTELCQKFANWLKRLFNES